MVRPLWLIQTHSQETESGYNHPYFTPKFLEDPSSYYVLTMPKPPERVLANEGPLQESRENKGGVNTLYILFQSYSEDSYKKFFGGWLFKKYILGQSSTKLGLDPVSSSPPKTKKLHNTM